MLDIFRTFQTDAAKEIDGVWHDLGQKARIKVARFGNANAGALFEKLQSEHAEVLKNGTEAEKEKVGETIMNAVLAATILTDFEEIGFKGEALKYSEVNARRLMTVPDFKNLVVTLSRQRENFLVDEEAAVAKN